jgi:hypothetical protein
MKVGVFIFILYFFFPQEKVTKRTLRPARKAINSDSLTKTSQAANAKREVFLRSLCLEFIALYYAKAEKFRLKLIKIFSFLPK